MTKYVLAVLALFIFCILLFCSKSTAPVGPSKSITLEQILEFQNDFSTKYEYYLDYFDSTEALDKIANLVSEETELVQSVVQTEQGLEVEYTNGLRGGLLVDPGDHYSDLYGHNTQAPENSEPAAKPAYVAPNSKRSLFLCPIYSTRWKVADSISALAQNAITKAGYQPFTKKLQAGCGIADFIQIYNYGLIHIYTFNFDWYENEVLSDVYLMTGDSVSQYLNDHYEAKISNKDLAVIYVPGYGNVYFIRPALIADAIDLGSEQPLFFLGYGNSLDGGWPEELSTGAVIGFEGAVDAPHYLKWSQDLYSVMSDTSDFKQITVQDWYENIESSYIDENYVPPRSVRIDYYGSGDFVLWQSLRVTEIVPEMGFVGDTIEIHGIGFGAVQADGFVTIGSQTAGVVSWSDTLILATVPEDADQNGIGIFILDHSCQNIGFSVLQDIAILAVTPDRIYRGYLTSIHGFGFGETGGDSYIKFGNSIFDDVVYWSDTLIQEYIASWVEFGTAQVITPESESNIFSFNLITEVIINSMTPAVGKSGDTIAIRGTYLGYDPGIVYFASTKVSGGQIVNWSDTLINVIVPNNSDYGQIAVKVISHNLTSNEKSFFKQTYSTITSITPNDVVQLDTVTIGGSGFGEEMGASKVEFKRTSSSYGYPAEIVSWSDTEIVAIVPLRAITGIVSVKVNDYYSNAFNITIFGINSVSPSLGIPGTYIDIDGSEFGSSQGSSQVTLNGDELIVTRWLDFGVDCKLPERVSSGDLIVTVNGRSTTPIHFKVPQVFDVYPEWVAPGMMVTITGVDLGLQVYPLYFTGGACDYIESWSDTLVIAQVPESAMSGPIEVRSYGMQGLLSPPIQILDITALDPMYGLPGDTIDILGTGFWDYAGSNFVTLNDQEISIVAWSDTKITAIIPPEADSGQIVVHVNGYASTGEELAIVGLDDIFELLYQAPICQTKFSGMMKFTGSDEEYTEMVIENVATAPGSWAVNSYSYQDGNGSNNGTIDISGVEIISQNTRHEQFQYIAWPPKEYLEYYKFNLNNIPFSSIELELDYMYVIFEISGPEAENHISDIQTYIMNIYQDMHDIYTDYNWYYQYTDWDNEEYPPRIEVIFKIPYN